MRYIENRHVAATAVILSSLMFVIGAAVAGERIARQGDDEARFSEEPCTHPAVTARLDPRLVKEYRAATVTFQGQVYAACYLEDRNAFFLVFEDGDQGVVQHRDLLRSM